VPRPKKYHTDEERREARRQSYRKHYKLRKARQLKRLLHPQEVLLPRVKSA
jgi:hypothetical protein